LAEILGEADDADIFLLREYMFSFLFNSNSSERRPFKEEDFNEGNKFELVRKTNPFRNYFFMNTEKDLQKEINEKYGSPPIFKIVNITPGKNNNNQEETIVEGNNNNDNKIFNFKKDNDGTYYFQIDNDNNKKLIPYTIQDNPIQFKKANNDKNANENSALLQYEKLGGKRKRKTKTKIKRKGKRKNKTKKKI
jgi:hypothetical protein